TIVMSNTHPPVSLALNVTKNDVLDWGRQSWNLPRNVRLPTSPCFGKMLQDCVDLAILHSNRHHVGNVMNNSGTQFEIKMGFNSLLRDSLRNTLGVTTLELTRQKISQPSLKKWNNTTEKEEPDSPSWSPKATSGPF